MPGLLVDTNVLIYLYDRESPEKQARSLAVLDRLVQEQQGLVSTQVLAEFLWVATRRLADPLSLDEATASVNRYLDTWIILDVTGDVVREACRGARVYQLPYWDAQIWATAHVNDVPIILSEDFQDQRLIEGVRSVNPFNPDFDLMFWLSR